MTFRTKKLPPNHLITRVRRAEVQLQLLEEQLAHLLVGESVWLKNAVSILKEASHGS